MGKNTVKDGISAQNGAAAAPALLRRLTLLLFILLSLQSCFLRRQEYVATLPAEGASAFAESWAVLSSPYTAYLAEPESPAVASHGRMGDMERVTGKRITREKNKTVIWYHFEKGWLPESAVVVYDNKLKAQTAAAALIRKQ